MHKPKDPMIVLVVLKAPESSLDLQKSEMPLVYLKKIKTLLKNANIQGGYKLTAFYTRIPQGIE